MGFCAQFKALLKKNWILWYRNLCGSLCEILLPVILVFIIVVVRNLVNDETVPEQSYLDKGGSAYYLDEALKLKFNSSAPSNSDALGLKAGNPFIGCLYYGRPIIGFVGTHRLYDKLKADLFSSSAGNTRLHYPRSLFRELHVLLPV